MKFKLLFISLLAAIAMTACGKQEEAAKTETPAADAAKTETPAADAAKTETPAADAAKTETPAADVAMVPECEEYFKKLEICINDKIPTEQRATIKQGLEKIRVDLAQVTDNAIAAQQCKTYQEQAKTVYQAMGCSF